jgi:hypothetical protein
MLFDEANVSKIRRIPSKKKVLLPLLYLSHKDGCFLFAISTLQTHKKALSLPPEK